MIHGNWKPIHGSLFGERLHRDGIWAAMLLHVQDEVVVQLLSHVRVFAAPWTAACWASLSITNSQSSNLCPLSRWWHPTFLFPVIPFSCPQSFPASISNESVLCIRWPEYWGFSISPFMNTQSWFPLGLTGLTSLQSKGLSRVFSNTTVQKYQFFSAQPSLWSNFHIHTWLLEKP